MFVLSAKLIGFRYETDYNACVMITLEASVRYDDRGLVVVCSRVNVLSLKKRNIIVDPV